MPGFKNKKSNNGIAGLLAAFFLIFNYGLPVATASWQLPTLSAPGGVFPSPAINVGRFTQEKLGSLEIAGDFSSGVLPHLPNLPDWRFRLAGRAGIGDYFINHEPGEDLDISGNARGKQFCFPDPINHDLLGQCLSFGSGFGTVGPPGPDGKSSSQGLVGMNGLPGLPGTNGKDGKNGLPGPNVVDTSGLFIQKISAGTGIIFKSTSGKKTTSIGKGLTPNATISRDFGADPCIPTNIGINYLNSIDPSGFTTCATNSSGNNNQGSSGLTDLAVSDSPTSLGINLLSASSYDLYVQGTAIQGTVVRGCGQGQAIGRIRQQGGSGYQDVDIECTLAGAIKAGRCGLAGRIFYCIEADGAITSIDIPLPGAPAPACKKEGESLGAIVPGNTAVCCPGLVRYHSDPYAIGGGGTCEKPQSPATVDIKANNSNGPISVSAGTLVDISWVPSPGTNSCTASGGWSGTKIADAWYEPVNVTQSNTYTITCTGSGGTASDSVNVNIASVSSPTVDLKANGVNGPISVSSGASVSLSWTSTNASSCSASGGWSGSKAVSGSESKNATQSETLTLNCIGAGGTASDSVTVNVAAAPPPALTSEWKTITYGGGKFVAVAGPGGTNGIMTSADGVTWTGSNSPVNDLWFSSAYGNGMFVAVSLRNHGSDQVMSSSNGLNWTVRNSPKQSWDSVAYGNGKFVAVSNNGTSLWTVQKNSPDVVMTSPDGINWTGRIAPEQYWTSVAYGNGLFVAVAGNSDGTGVMTSPDGVNWTRRNSGTGTNSNGSGKNYWSSVTYANGLFVAVASQAGNIVITSPDGINWTQRTAPNQSWRGVTFGNGLFAALSYTGGIMTSSDGVTWTSRAGPGGFNWTSITYGNGTFVAVSSSGDVWTSNMKAADFPSPPSTPPTPPTPPTSPPPGPPPPPPPPSSTLNINTNIPVPNITSINPGAGSLRINWSFVGADGYYVYRGSSANFIPSLSNRDFDMKSSSFQTILEDSNNTRFGISSGVTYCYKVSAYVISGGESPTPANGTCAVPN